MSKSHLTVPRPSFISSPAVPSQAETQASMQSSCYNATSLSPCSTIATGPGQCGYHGHTCAFPHGFYPVPVPKQQIAQVGTSALAQPAVDPARLRNTAPWGLGQHRTSLMLPPVGLQLPPIRTSPYQASVDAILLPRSRDPVIRQRAAIACRYCRRRKVSSSCCTDRRTLLTTS